MIQRRKNLYLRRKVNCEMRAGLPHRAQERRPDEFYKLGCVMKHGKPMGFARLEIDLLESEQFDSFHFRVRVDRAIHYPDEKRGIRMTTFYRIGQDASARELLSQHNCAAHHRFCAHSSES